MIVTIRSKITHHIIGTVIIAMKHENMISKGNLNIKSKNIAYALQNPILKKGTIKSNLTQRNQHITNKYIYKSLEVS